MLTYAVKALFAKEAGSLETCQIDEAIAFDASENLPVKSRLTGKVIFIKLEHEINVQLEDVKLDIEATCSRCLTKYQQPLRIPFAEREFSVDLPEAESLPGEDLFFIDKRTWKISLLEMVRQEILLHFPSIPVCSVSCKGLCDQCGKNLNLAICSCPRSTEEKEKPLKILKDFLR